jgi:hypothetical protein
MLGVYSDILSMAVVKFVARISDMGEKQIIIIPKDFHKLSAKMKGKQVKVILDDEI